MGRIKLLRIARAAAFVGVALAAVTANAQVTNSVHDFSKTGTGGKWTNNTVDQICVFCHVPHHAVSSIALWNRAIQATNYNVFTSTFYTLNEQQPATESRRCLSCHDGSVAVDAMNRPPPGFISLAAQGLVDKLGDIYYPGSPYFNGFGANIGNNYAGNPTANNLRDDHPISFQWTGALTTASNAKTNGHGLITPDYANGTADPGPNGKLPLYGASSNQLECSTCHDVHDTSGKLPRLLRVSNTGSALCLSCHLK